MGGPARSITIYNSMKDYNFSGRLPMHFRKVYKPDRAISLSRLQELLIQIKSRWDRVTGLQETFTKDLELKWRS